MGESGIEILKSATGISQQLHSDLWQKSSFFPIFLLIGG
jgi:hypothetical protein